MPCSHDLKADLENRQGRKSYTDITRERPPGQEPEDQNPKGPETLEGVPAPADNEEDAVIKAINNSPGNF